MKKQKCTENVVTKPYSSFKESLKKQQKSIKKQSKPYHLLRYVEDCSPKTKLFKSLKSLNLFIYDFQAEYGIESRGDNWIDYSVTNITGDVHIYDPSAALEK